MAFAIEAVRYGPDGYISHIRWRSLSTAPNADSPAAIVVGIERVWAAAAKGHTLYLDGTDSPRNKVVLSRNFLSGATLVDGPQTTSGTKLADLPIF